jgi:WD40 repeat protein
MAVSYKFTARNIYMKQFFFTVFVLTGVLLSFQVQAQMPNTDIYLVSLQAQKGKFKLGTPLNITARMGYDNQPAFSPDGTYILYVSVRDKQADIYKYNIAAGTTEAFCTTPEDEFSPTFIPDGSGVSVVRVEKDSTQRLWKFGMQGGNSPALLLDKIDSIGYHCWLSADRLGLVMITEPASLLIAYEKTQIFHKAAKDVGRAICLIPGKDGLLSFVDKSQALDSAFWLYSLDAKGKKTPIVKMLPGSEDYCWMQDGSILAGSKGKLYRYRPAKDKDWQEVANFSGTEVKDFYRLAVSPEGDYVALVSFSGKKP